MNMAERIRSAMLEKDISYGELSAQTGIPKSALHRYATGQTKRIPVDRIVKISAALGTTLNHIILGVVETPGNVKDDTD